jgi:Zn-dependent protease with chaperone function
MRSTSSAHLIGLVFVLAAGCVPPTTQLGNVSQDVIRAEQLKQQQLVLRTDFEYQQRLDDVAYPLLKAAVPLCTKAVGPLSGIRFANVHSFKKEYRAAARGLGFTDTLAIVGVTEGSAAERAGVKTGDRIVSVGGAAAPAGPTAPVDFLKQLSQRATAKASAAQAISSEPVRLTMRRGANGESGTGTSSEIALELPADTVCVYNAVAIKDEVLNAYADGKNVVITSGMLRFAGNDDELAVVVAHEIAHNAMGHIDAKKKNATFGAILGAIVDIAAATQGVNTGGDFTSLGAEFGAMTFSQDFEREADYVGMYILARADRAIAKAPDFWRRMAQESPGSIKFASSHPTTAERFVRLESAVAEIEQKRVAGAPLTPEMKATTPQKGKRQ